MATQTPGLFTYAEWALRLDPNGKASTLINLLSQNNSILDDCLAVECNSGNAHQFTQVTSLPTPARRVYNTGVPRTMGGVGKQTMTCAMYSDWSVMDDALARLGGNLAELRAKELKLHMEGMGQKVATDLFYVNRATDPTAYTGFANIYNTVSTSTSQIATNVVDCGGTGSTNASLWLLGWGDTQIHTIFPQGMPAGLVHEDLGKSFVADSSGNEFLGWRDWLEWNIGVCIQDWRYGVRACNIDVTLFGGGSAVNLINLLADMVYKPPIMPAGVAPVQTSDDPEMVTMARSAFYLNRSVILALDLQAQNKTNVLLQMEQWDGKPVLAYRKIPMRVVDALTIAESRVV